jgi:arylsulfatase A-like enzyme
MHKYISTVILTFLITSISINAQKKADNSKPNIIIIFADDLGYGDIGCYGAKGYQTPVIDKMANDGMRFTDFSVSNPICTPSRAGLLTGRYPERWGYEKGVFTPLTKTGMPTSEITIAEVLKQKGYNTAAIGKWHLGHQPEYLPTNQGFNYYFGIPYSNDMHQDGGAPLASNAKILDGYTLQDYNSLKKGVAKIREVSKKFKRKVPLLEGKEVIEWPVDQTQLTRRYTEKAVEFIDENTDKPFFLYLAHSMPHTPLFASDKFKGKTERGLYGDVLEEIDWSVGKVMKALKENGLDKNTLVLFSSDNGPWLIQKENGGSAGELRGGKVTTYEGGIRVPFIAYWPKTIPKGKVCNKHITSFDILPTIGALTHAKIPKDRVLDGLDISDILKGKTNKDLKREFFMTSHFNYKDYMIRVGDWKYRKGTATDIPNKKAPLEVQLFNLKKDPNERNNLADKHPEKVKEMAEKLKLKYDLIKMK